MSRPANPLNQYRSYSYYHVLVLCDSTETADVLAKSSDANIWHHPTGPQAGLQDARDDTFPLLGRYAVKYLKPDTSSQKYCVLINGATDASFTIPRAKWSSVTAAAATVMDQSTSIAVEGELEISEPKGVVFLDIVVNCCLALGIDAANAIFVLKTFFVGYPDSQGDTSTDSYMINDIEPIRFIAYDISGSFAETGGRYLMSFVAVSNGAARLPQYSKSASGFSFTANDSLKSTIETLAGVVATNYDRLYACVESTIKGNESTQQFADSLCRVSYTFSIDETLAGSEYTVTDSQAQSKNNVSCDSPSTLTFPANMSIEDAIHIVMKHCPKVQKDMTEGILQDGKQVCYEYKIQSAYSSKADAAGKIAHNIHYHVQRFMRPKDLALFELAATADENTQLEALKRNTIEFDYLYTGLNIDILEFDIKLNMGLQYLQIATISNTLKGQLQTTPSSFQHVPKYDQENMGRLGKVAQIPVMFGSQIQTPSTRNKQSVSDSVESSYTMSKHASIEVQDVTMKIYGNPRLLSSVNRTTSPESIGTSDNHVLDTEASFYEWATHPAFAKINIRMPRNNDDIGLFRRDITGTGVDEELGFTKEFWFTGYYYVHGITHEFNEGEFAQTLDMIGIPKRSAAAAITSAPSTEFNAQKEIYACYDAIIDPCSGSQTPTETTMAVPPTLPPSSRAAGETTARPTTQQDAESINKTIDPNKVVGYQASDPKVKAAISSASSKHGIPQGDMVAIAAVESNFKPTAVNSSAANATGLYQITKSTWFGNKSGDGIVSKYGKILGIANMTREQQDAARTDPNINAEAAALLIKENKAAIKQVVGGGYEPTSYDVHLAHFAGSSIAAKVIDFSKSGAGNTTMAEVYAGSRTSWERVLQENPDLRKNNIQTVSEFREYKAAQLSRAVGGVPVAEPRNVVATSPQNTVTSTGSSGPQPTSVSQNSNKGVRHISAAARAAHQRSCADKTVASQKAIKQSGECNQTPDQSKVISEGSSQAGRTGVTTEIVDYNTLNQAG